MYMEMHGAAITLHGGGERGDQRSSHGEDRRGGGGPRGAAGAHAALLCPLLVFMCYLHFACPVETSFDLIAVVVWSCMGRAFS